MSKKQRYSKMHHNIFGDDEMFHGHYANYNTRKTKQTNHNNDASLLDEAGIDADESESYEETASSDSNSDSESSSSTQDESNKSDQFEYRNKNQTKQSTFNDIDKDQHSLDYDQDDDLLFASISESQRKKDEEDNITGLKCAMLICLFCTAIIISMLFGIRSQTVDEIDINQSIQIVDTNETQSYNINNNPTHNIIHHTNDPTHKPTTKSPSISITKKTNKPTNKPTTTTTTTTTKAPVPSQKPTIKPTTTTTTTSTTTKVPFEPTPVITKPPSSSIKKVNDVSTAIQMDKKAVKQPICSNSIFTATSWNSINVPQSEICAKFISGQTYLSPSEPQHVIASHFECALNNNPQSCAIHFGHDYVINVLHGFADLSATDRISAYMDCIEEPIFEPIYFEYGPYDNNENYIECLRIDMSHSQLQQDIKLKQKSLRQLWLREYAVNDKNMHSLRVEFTMLEMDVEPGFDNVFLSWQYNNIYSPNYVHWTGKNKSFQPQPGVPFSKTLFWNVLSGDYLQICLNLKSDQDITSNGFKGMFTIRKELGVWSDWSECKTAPSAQRYRYGGQCGIGVRNKTKICANGRIDDGEHICVEEHTLNEFCIKANCQDIDNTDPLILPEKEKPGKLKPDDFEWRFNGKHRVDPVYPDPFRYILAANTKIDVSLMIKQIQDKMKEIASRYSDERILTYGIGEGINNYNTLETRIEARLLRSLLLGRSFVVSFTGSSNTAGHDNMFMSSYSMQLLSTLRTFWATIGYNGAAFHVHNVAEGGHLGTKKLSWCTNQLVPDDSDFVFWESLMNDAGDKRNFEIFERWVRNVLSLPKNPIWGVINTGEAADRYGDNCRNKSGISVPYCKIRNGVNMYWWRDVRPIYEASSDMLFVGARRGCYALADAVPECSGLSVTWHPSPNGHRLYAETFAYWFLKVALHGLQKYQNQIEKLIKDTGGRPSVELECLLHDPEYADKQNSALPHVEPQFCGASCKQAPNWCTSSYLPVAQQERIHNFVLSDDNGSWVSNIDGTGSEMGPLIWRHGGQDPIDHKIQWGTKIVGASLVIRVNVMSCCIVILDPMSGGGMLWHNQLEFSVDDKVVECNYSGKLLSGYLWNNNLAGCVIQTQKGKRNLKIKYVNQTKVGRYAAIDMIATF